MVIGSVVRWLNALDLVDQSIRLMDRGMASALSEYNLSLAL